MPPTSKKEGGKGDLAWTKNVTKKEKFKIQQMQQGMLPSRAPLRKVPLLPGHAASKIQAGFKGMKARREVKVLKEQNSAAVKIQAGFKGMKARRKVEVLRHEKEENDAAVKIQAGFKGMKARQEVKVLREQNAAAEKIQAGFKGMKVRKELKEQDEAAKKIQAGFKGMKVRRAKLRPGKKLWLKLRWKIRTVARMSMKGPKDGKKSKKPKIVKRVSLVVAPEEDDTGSDRSRRVSLAPVPRRSSTIAAQPTDPTINRGFLFLAPQSNTSKSQDVIRKALANNKITIVSEGKIPSKVIDQEMLLDQQYYKMASVATLLKPGQAPINAQVFERQTGVGWRTVLDKRLVFNAIDACEFLGVDGEKLAEMWEKAEMDGKVYTIGECQQCGILNDSSGKKTIYVLNGFFMAKRRLYTYSGAIVHYFSVKWPSAKLSYEQFLSDIVGNPEMSEKAKSGTIRSVLDRRWKALGQKSKNAARNSGLHVSESNLQALVEQLIWIRSKIEREPYARLLGEEGISASTIQRWKTNPRVFSTTAMTSTDFIFDVVRGLDAEECSKILKVVLSLESESQLAAPTVVNLGYEKGSKTGKKAIKDDQAYKAIMGKAAAGAKQTVNYHPKGKGSKGGISIKKKKRKAKGKDRFVSMGAQKAERMKERKSKDQFSTRNYALILVEHYAVTEKTVQMIQDTLREHHVNLRSKGPITAEEIRQRRIVDQHFYEEARTATGVNPKDINIPRLKFQSKFGTSWSQILKEGIAYNALQASDELGLSELDLAILWRETVTAGNVIMSDQGLVGRVSVPTKGVRSVKGKKGNSDIFICGGDFLAKRSRFTEPGTSTYYFSVDWDPKVMKWKDFNEKCIGHTESAPDASLNQLVRANWETLDVRKEPPENEDCIHGSMSPVEAMSERMNWLDFSISQDYFSRSLQQAGLTDSAIQYLRFDPDVKGDGRQKQPVSWSVTGMDVSNAIAYCSSLQDELDMLAHASGVDASAPSGGWGGRPSIATKKMNMLNEDEFVELKIKDTGEGDETQMDLIFPAKLAEELSFVSMAKISHADPIDDELADLMKDDVDDEHASTASPASPAKGEGAGGKKENGKAKGKGKGKEKLKSKQKQKQKHKTSDVLITAPPPEEGEADRRSSAGGSLLKERGSKSKKSDSGICINAEGGEEGNGDAKSHLGSDLGSMKHGSTQISYVSFKLVADVSRYLTQKNSEEVRELELGFNGEDVEDEDVVKICAKIEVSNDRIILLNLSNNEIGDAGAEALGNLLIEDIKIMQEIDLGANVIGDRGMKYIAAGLAQNAVLQSINFNENEFGEKGAVALFKALAVNRSLVSIDVGANDLGSKGAKALIKMMKSNNTLTKVGTLEASGITKSQRKLLDALIAVNNKQSLTPKAIIAAKEVILSSMPSTATIGGSASGGVVM